MKQYIALMFLGLSGAVGCSSDPEPDPYPTSQSYVAARAKAECEAGGKACGHGSTIDACVAWRTTAINDQVAAAGTRTYDKSAVQNCLDTSKSILAKPLIGYDDWVKLTDACDKVYRGAVEKFGACTTAYDCKDSTNLCDKGKCAPKIEKATGDLCSDPGAVCARTATCSGDPKMCTARTLKGAGDNCDPAADECSDAARICDAFDTAKKCKAQYVLDPATAFCKVYFGAP